MRQLFPPLEDDIIKADLSGPLSDMADPKVVGPDRVVLSENAKYHVGGDVRKVAGYSVHGYALARTSPAAYLRYPHFMGAFDDKLLVAGVPKDSNGYNYPNEYYSLHGLNKAPAVTDELVDLGKYPAARQSSETVNLAESTGHWLIPSSPPYDPDIALLGGYTWIVWTDLDSVFITVKEEDSGLIVHEGVVFDATAAGKAVYNPKIIAVNTKLHLWCIAYDGVDYGLHWVELDSADPDGYTAGAPGVANPSYMAAVNAVAIMDACYYLDNDYSHSSIAVFKDDATGQMRFYSKDAGGTNRKDFLDAQVPTNTIGVAYLYDYVGTASYLVVATRKNGASDYEYLVYDDDNGVGAITTLTQLKAATKFDDNIAGDHLTKVTMAANSAESRAGVVDNSFVIFAEKWPAAAAVPSTVAYRVRLESPWTVITPAAASGESFWYFYRLQTKAITHLDRAHVWLTYDSEYKVDGTTKIHDDPSILIAFGPQYTASVYTYYPVANMFAGNTWHRYDSGAPGAVQRQGLGSVVACSGTDSGRFLWACITREAGLGERGSGGLGLWRAESQLFAVRQNVIEFSGDGNFKFYNRGASAGKNLLLEGGSICCFDGRAQTHGFLHAPRITGISDGAQALSVPNGAYRYMAVYEWTDRNGEVHYSVASPDETHTVAGGPKKVTVSVTGFVPDMEQKDIKICLFRTAGEGLGSAVAVGYQLVAVADNPCPSNSVVNIDDVYADADRGREIYTAGDVMEDAMPPPASAICTHKDRIWLVSDEDRRKLYYSKPKVDGLAAAFPSECYVSMPEEINAIAGTDEYLYAFSGAKIYAIGGEGPSANGVGSFWLPRVIATDIGCSNAASVALTTLGVVFQNKDALYSISSQGLQRVPPDVSAPYFTSPVVKIIEERGADTLWIFSNGQAPYTYNYRLNRWSFMNGHAQPEGVCYYDDIATGLWFVVDAATGAELLEPSAAYVRKGVGYVFKVKTPWLRLANLTGFQRVRWINMLGVWVATHTARVKLYNNYDESVVAQTEDIAVTADPKKYLYRIKPNTQKVTAIQLSVEDVSSTSASMRLSAAELVCGFKGAHNRRPTGTT